MKRKMVIVFFCLALVVACSPGTDTAETGDGCGPNQCDVNGTCVDSKETVNGQLCMNGSIVSFPSAPGSAGG